MLMRMVVLPSMRRLRNLPTTTVGQEKSRLMGDQNFDAPETASRIHMIYYLQRRRVIVFYQKLFCPVRRSTCAVRHHNSRQNRNNSKLPQPTAHLMCMQLSPVILHVDPTLPARFTLSRSFHWCT